MFSLLKIQSITLKLSTLNNLGINFVLKQKYFFLSKGTLLDLHSFVRVDETCLYSFNVGTFVCLILKTFLH